MVVGIGIGSPVSAQAQIWIGQIVGELAAQGQAQAQEHACMTGKAMPPDEIAETRPTALATMTAYWDAVRGGAPAGIAALYYPDRNAKWVTGTTVLLPATAVKVSDPIAVPGAKLVESPVGYVRSGDGKWVQGQWQVRRGDGGPGGTYDVTFRRSGRTWLLSALRVVPAREYIDPVVQFCHRVGDVMPYRLTWSARTRVETAKRADKTRVRAEKARILAERTPSGSETVPNRQRAIDLAVKARIAEEAAQVAIREDELAKSDAAAAAARRDAAMAELAIR